MSEITCYIENGFPAVISFGQPLSTAGFNIWVNAHKGLLDELLFDAGAILFRGVTMNSLETFKEVVEGMIVPRSFLESNATRTQFNPGILNASEYDPKRKIHLHTEFSHSYHFPEKLIFGCIQPADSGGATLIADNRKLTSLLDKELVRCFVEKGITYRRNLHGGSGVGPSWQECFQTEDREVVAAYCKSNNMSFSWTNNGGLLLVYTNEALRKHPVSGDYVWFNHIDQFLLSFLYEPEVFEGMLLLHGNDENALPMHVTYGDGGAIPGKFLKDLHALFEKIEVPVQWNRGEILLIDNLLTLHGRSAYEGNRKVLVSMS
ncbi:TauD/TfdA family dioxygenase [Chitinophaga oryzae]|uniref:TauD/TfdA family dioxygenase n=1 Tax=Chitinophaga oryzae TaxID=2725414 RepID=A0AAE6ZCZ2_9BACT|nr:TauD/TfdA family dioxygenase [Chitinophaga oryzae]QJB30476.1 TauD/TfdA family dioxygenase [Chitinophaga oryzae]